MKDTKIKRRTLLRAEDLVPVIEWSCRKCKKVNREVGGDEVDILLMETIDCSGCGHIHTIRYR